MQTIWGNNNAEKKRNQEKVKVEEEKKMAEEERKFLVLFNALLTKLMNFRRKQKVRTQKNKMRADKFIYLRGKKLLLIG